MRLQTSGSAGACGGLPNSRMSAPPMKLRPAPTSTTALTAGIGVGRFDGRQQAAPHVDAERIDGRVVDRDEEDVAVAGLVQDVGLVRPEVLACLLD